jgi:hypothetical protein
MEEMKVYWEYRYLKTEGLVKMYFINGIPFTWDELDKTPSLDVILKARNEYVYSIDELYHGSMYLLEEGFHPLLDQLNLDETSELPE